MAVIWVAMKRLQHGGTCMAVVDADMVLTTNGWNGDIDGML